MKTPSPKFSSLPVKVYCKTHGYEKTGTLSSVNLMGQHVYEITIKKCSDYKRYVMRYRPCDGLCRISYERNKLGSRVDANIQVSEFNVCANAISMIWHEGGSQWYIESTTE